MISKSEYILVGKISVVTNKLVTQYHSVEEADQFGRFMTGQTCMVIPDGTVGIYSWDYERWLESKSK